MGRSAPARAQHFKRRCSRLTPGGAGEEENHKCCGGEEVGTVHCVLLNKQLLTEPCLILKKTFCPFYIIHSNFFFVVSLHKQTNGSMTRRNTYVCERSSTDRYSAIPNGKDSRYVLTFRLIYRSVFTPVVLLLCFVLVSSHTLKATSELKCVTRNHMRTPSLLIG